MTRAGREGDSQPMPTPRGDEVLSVHSWVIADLLKREELGVRRYGTKLQPHNGRSALLDMYEELLDAAVYCKQLLMEQEQGA